MNDLTATQGSFSDRFRMEYRYSKPILFIYLSVFLSFPVAKGILRPWAISTIPDRFFKTVLFSYTNFAEAVLGLTTVSAILFLLRNWCRERFERNLIQDTFLYWIAAFLSAINVITQEIKINDLSRENIDDINDEDANCKR